jgi:TRAP-type mannitol/chloroaromatic compound transport system permease small subunit
MELYFIFGLLFIVSGATVVYGPIAVSDGIAKMLEKIAFTFGWLLVVLMCVTCFDVFSRKMGLPISLTRFQELEWWLHTTIFSTWMGYNYTINAHPRVDSFTENASFRRRAWLELFGCVFLAFPYIFVVCYYSLDFVYQSWRVDEGSESAIGLPHRWIIKGIYVAGIWLVLLAIISVFLRVSAYLFGGVPQERANLQIGKSELEV